MEPKGSLSCYKDLATWPHSVSDEFIPHPSFVCKFHLVVFFLCLGRRSFKPLCFLQFSNHNPVCTAVLSQLCPMACDLSTYLISLLYMVKSTTEEAPYAVYCTLLWPSVFRSKYSQHSLPVHTIMFFPHCQTPLFAPINIQRCKSPYMLQQLHYS